MLMMPKIKSLLSVGNLEKLIFAAFREICSLLPCLRSFAGKYEKGLFFLNFYGGITKTQSICAQKYIFTVLEYIADTERLSSSLAVLAQEF